MMAHERRDTVRQFRIAAGLSLLAAVAFYFSTNATLRDLDYTSQIASALLRGHLGLREKPPDWLNEMIPLGDRYYSAFPLGAVVSMLPVALLRSAGLIQSFPGHILAALIAGLCVYFFFQLANAFKGDWDNSLPIRPLAIPARRSRLLRRSGCEGWIGVGGWPVRRVLLALFPIFGTWTWCNLGFGGAWQIALGLALLGQIAALYFVLVEFRPFLAGAFFALALGNRTELVLCLPIFVYFLIRRVAPDAKDWKALAQQSREKLGVLISFLIFPVALGFLTAFYNYARFHSIFDFGYAHIPNLLQEPWYQ